MRKQVVRQAVDKGLRAAAATTSRTRTRLPTSSPVSPATTTTTTTTTGGQGWGDGVCPHHKQPHIGVNNRCVFTQTRSTRDELSAAGPLTPSTTATTTTATATATARARDVCPAEVRSMDAMPGPKGYPVVGTLLEYFRKENRGRMHEIQVR